MPRLRRVHKWSILELFGIKQFVEQVNALDSGAIVRY